MVDLNLWRLSYGTTVLEFGTHDTGYPLTKQVEIGSVTMESTDTNRPMGDGILFGEDRVRGRLFRFQGAHLDRAPKTTSRAWDRPLDSARIIARAWAADEVRTKPGAVASLEHVDRGVIVYGRPRNRTADLELVRQGWSTWDGEFATVDPLFYSATEQVVTTQVAAGAAGGMVFPLRFPLVTTAVVSSRRWLASAGTSPSPATVVFRGPSTNPTAELLGPDGSVRWSVSVSGGLAYDETFTIDARPWARGMTLNGSPAPGRVRGDKVDALQVPPGVSELRYTASADPTGASTCTIRWRDAHDEL